MANQRDTPSQPDFAKLAEELENVAHERAGGGPGTYDYDPELLDVMTSAADALRLAAQAQEDRKDAERYKWLRRNCDLIWHHFAPREDATLNDFDAAIDKHMAAEKGERS